MDSQEDEKTNLPETLISEQTRPENNVDEIAQSDPNPSTLTTSEPLTNPNPNPNLESDPMPLESTENLTKTESLGSESMSLGSINDDAQNPDQKIAKEEHPDDHPSKKHKSSPPIDNLGQTPPSKTPSNKKSSKKKSKGNSVWTKPTSRKSKKKAKNFNNNANKLDTTLFISPIMRIPDKNDDSPELSICLSKLHKAEKVELSDDRLTAGSCKGYRMVRATRGVIEGAWYFEIKVVNLGETGHTRLGWSTDKGDLQAPVGYDSHSFGYRDVDGSKVHKALREKYGDVGYNEGDVIGFYVSLPNGSEYAPKVPKVVWYKGQRYVCGTEAKEEPPKIVPGSQISFFKNGISQGVAFRDLSGGRYYPAASMYTLPNQPNCVVKFNFGPDFECFPKDFGDCPIPRPMIEVPYHELDGAVENGALHDNKQ